MIIAIGILSIFSPRAARLNVSHCSGRIVYLQDAMRTCAAVDGSYLNNWQISAHEPAPQHLCQGLWKLYGCRSKVTHTSTSLRPSHHTVRPPRHTSNSYLLCRNAFGRAYLTAKSPKTQPGLAPRSLPLHGFLFSFARMRHGKWPNPL